MLEAMLKIFSELFFEPLPQLIHWFVRSLGGNNPRYFRFWVLLCWTSMSLAVLIFFGTVGCIINGIIGAMSMCWLFVGSFILLSVGLCALSVVEGTTEL